MQLLKKSNQLDKWGKKNKISKKRFSKLTGTSFKRLKKSKKLPKVVSLSCLALEMRKNVNDKDKSLKLVKKKNKNLKSKIVKITKNSNKLTKAKKKLEASLKKPKKSIKSLKNTNKKLKTKLKKPEKTIKSLKNTNKKLKSKLKGTNKKSKTSSSVGTKAVKPKESKKNGAVEKSNNQNNTFRTDLRKPVVDVNVKTTSD